MYNKLQFVMCNYHCCRMKILNLKMKLKRNLYPSQNPLHTCKSQAILKDTVIIIGFLSSFLVCIHRGFTKEYSIVKKLGKGGFGHVFQVLSKTDNAEYAIKIIRLPNE